MGQPISGVGKGLRSTATPQPRLTLGATRLADHDTLQQPLLSRLAEVSAEHPGQLSFPLFAGDAELLRLFLLLLFFLLFFDFFDDDDDTTG